MWLIGYNACIYVYIYIYVLFRTVLCTRRTSVSARWVCTYLCQHLALLCAICFDVGAHRQCFHFCCHCILKKYILASIDKFSMCVCGLCKCVCVCVCLSVCLFVCVCHNVWMYVCSYVCVCVSVGGCTSVSCAIFSVGPLWLPILFSRHSGLLVSCLLIAPHWVWALAFSCMQAFWPLAFALHASTWFHVLACFVVEIWVVLC
jgi:hypothetical protein